MKIHIRLSGALAGGVLLLIVLVVAVRSCSNKEPTTEDQRLAHLEYAVSLIEAYKQRYGSYPQPTAREEAVDGVRHVWGHRPGKPSLASCTVSLGKDGEPDALLSKCGGDVYDAQGTVIGWKGTLTAESALNNVEVALKGKGRFAAPLTDLTQEVPIDPAYVSHAALATQGFGEYVYAVRAPKDGAQNKGGIEYQIAATLPDPATGKLRTYIRGNYYVPSAERDILPLSLIGPGLLTDEHGIPLDGQERPLQVLLDAQQEGYPNPLLGEGEETLRALILRNQAQVLLRAVTARMEIAQALSPSEAVEDLRTSLQDLQQSLDALMEEFLEFEEITARDDAAPGESLGDAAPDIRSDALTAGAFDATPRGAEDVSAPPVDLNLLEEKIVEVAQSLERIIQDFLRKKSEEVTQALRAESVEREGLLSLLQDAMEQSESVHEHVLLARDELIRYLDGEGIEDQSRDRASREINTALEKVPELHILFRDKGLTVTNPFLSKEVQESIRRLSEQEKIPAGAHQGGENQEEKKGAGVGTGEMLTASGSQEDGSSASAEEHMVFTPPSSGSGSEEQLPVSAVMITTIASEVAVHFAELRQILLQVREDLRNPPFTVKEIDENLRRLSRALGDENERIMGFFSELAPADVAPLLLEKYEKLVAAEELVEAIHMVALFSRQEGDFASFLFTPRILEFTALERKPGIPDSTSYENPLEAEYKGIPYPLP